MKALAAGLILALLGPSVVHAQTAWPQFRGPDARGVADGQGLPTQWSATENVAWKTDLPGRGWSSPVVAGDRVFVTTVINHGDQEEIQKGLYFGGNRLTAPDSEHEWKVICLSLESGEVLWEETAHTGKPQSAHHLKNTYASETPVTDGERLYAYFGNLGVFCYDLDGKLLWSKRMDAKTMRFGWGTAASPVLHEDRLLIVHDNEQQSYLLALDKKTGEELWRVDRDEKSNWATPFIWQNELRTEIVTAGTGAVRSYDLDGKLLWQITGMSSITIATPYAADGLLYVSSGYVLDALRPVYAIRPGGMGDITPAKDATSNEFVAWMNREAAPYNPTSLVYDGLLYVLLDRGFLMCYDAVTGEQVYDRKRLPQGRAFTASPWAYDGHVFCISEDGLTFVLRAGRQFEILHTNSLAEDDMAMATPALVGDRLLVRTAARLYCIRQEAK